jgi:voltage-gated potassium channel Kch
VYARSKATPFGRGANPVTGEMMSIVFFRILALVLLGLVLQDAFEVMLLPRRTSRRTRLVRFFFWSTWKVWGGIAKRFANGPRRERFLSIYGPLSMLMLFVTWAASLIVSFGLLEWSLQSRAPGVFVSALTEQIYMSGITFFTLGYGDVVPHTGAGRFVAVVEAGSGIGFIAVVIGYLPVLYQLFARREAHVIQLDARAGSPPTAATMLRRHAESDGLDNLDDLLREWEVWASELMESHLSYPMLAYYRSQHDNQSWLAAIAAVMDTCALILVNVVDRPPLQARMTFTIARQVIVEMSRAFGAGPTATALYERLPHEAFIEMEAIFADAELDWHGGPAAEAILAALRATYEPLLENLSAALLLPLPGWVPTDETADHWSRGHQGDLASLLIDELSYRKRTSGDADVDREIRWEMLSRRLK